MRLDTETGLYFDKARFYASIVGRFLQTDPVGYSADLNLYTYVDNDPNDKTDPSGNAFGVDDALGLAGGALGGVGVELAKDAFFGEEPTAGGLAGAFVGGAILGEGVVNAPETGGGSLVLAATLRGAAAGFVGNSVQQGIDLASGAQTKYDPTSAVVSTAIGAATEGVVTKVGSVKLSKFSKGSGNWKAAAQAARTRVANGNAKNISPKTIVKGVVGGLVANSGKTATSLAGSVAQTEICKKQGGKAC